MALRERLACISCRTFWRGFSADRFINFTQSGWGGLQGRYQKLCWRTRDDVCWKMPPSLPFSCRRQWMIMPYKMQKEYSMYQKWSHVRISVCVWCCMQKLSISRSAGDWRGGSHFSDWIQFISVFINFRCLQARSHQMSPAAWCEIVALTPAGFIWDTLHARQFNAFCLCGMAPRVVMMSAATLGSTKGWYSEEEQCTPAQNEHLLPYLYKGKLFLPADIPHGSTKARCIPRTTAGPWRLCLFVHQTGPTRQSAILPVD